MQTDPEPERGSKGMYKEAIEEWKEVLKIDPNHKQSKEAIEKAKKKMEQTAKKR